MRTYSVLKPDGSVEVHRSKSHYRTALNSFRVYYDDRLIEYKASEWLQVQMEYNGKTKTITNKELVG